MRRIHLRQVDIADDIHIVHQERLSVVEEPGGLPDAAAGVEQLSAFVRQREAQSEVPVCGKVRLYLPGKMVDVDDDFVESVRNQFPHHDFQQRPALYGY